MIFKAKINTTNVALNISCKAGSLRNAKNFAFDCKTYCCKTRMYGTVKIAPIYMYYVAPETPMMSSVTADCPDLVPTIFWTSLRLCPGRRAAERKTRSRRYQPPSSVVWSSHIHVHVCYFACRPPMRISIYALSVRVCVLECVCECARLCVRGR